MRARMIGASMATGDVLFFQDGHTENNAGWAEPLLAEIAKNPHTVIQPSVDQIEAWTIEYIGGYGIGAVPRGGFSWDLRSVFGHASLANSAALRLYYDLHMLQEYCKLIPALSIQSQFLVKRHHVTYFH